MVKSAQVKQSLLIMGDTVVEPGRFGTMNKGRQKSSDYITFFWI